MPTKKNTKKPVIIDNDPIQPDDNGRGASRKELQTVNRSVDLRGVMEEKRYKVLMQPPPPHAIRKRPDGYDYLSHGYVTLTLNEIFGFDWDHRLLPVFDGNYYQYIPAEEANMPTGNPCVVVFGELTIRIHKLDKDGNSVGIAATIVKTGFGSAEVRKKQERGDACKGAQSDSRKVCAAQLGPRLGLTLYWDDEAKQEDYERRQQAKREAEEALERVTPERIEQARQMIADGKSPKETTKATGLTIEDLAEAGLL